jgi:hypothetical protein
MLPLPGLSPISGKTIVAKFDGGLLSSHGVIVVLREVEQRLRVADRLAACMVDPRAPEHISHTLADIIRFQLLMIAARYEDGNDASSLHGPAARRHFSWRGRSVPNGDDVDGRLIKRIHTKRRPMSRGRSQ